MFTPVHLQQHSRSSAKKPVSPLLSHLTVPIPRRLVIWFISAFGDSPNIRRNTVPATTTDVSAGRKYIDLKKSAFFINFEFKSAANISGNGIRSISVHTMYFTLFRTALKKILSVSILE